MSSKSDVDRLDEAFFEIAQQLQEGRIYQRPITLRLDEDVIDWFKAQGPGFHARMNMILRAYMLAKMKD